MHGTSWLSENICKQMKGKCLSASGYWGTSWAHCSYAKINCKKNTCKEYPYKIKIYEEI